MSFYLRSSFFDCAF